MKKRAPTSVSLKRAARELLRLHAQSIEVVA
jgi:hypothetical protein